MRGLSRVLEHQKRSGGGITSAAYVLLQGNLRGLPPQPANPGDTSERNESERRHQDGRWNGDGGPGTLNNGPFLEAVIRVAGGSGRIPKLRKQNEILGVIAPERIVPHIQEHVA